MGYNRFFLYYRLTHFYQSDVAYVKSISRPQLLGEALSAADLASVCFPVSSYNSTPYYPCGIIADSRFNDTISMTIPNATVSNTSVLLNTTGIAWPSDKEELFKSTSYAPSEALPPPSWNMAGMRWPTSPFVISKDENLMNWMRVSAFSSFLKLYGIVTIAGTKMPSIPIQLNIKSNFPIQKYGGRKSVFITSQSTIVGGRQLALPLVFLTTGILLIAIGSIICIYEFYRCPKLHTSNIEQEMRALLSIESRPI